MKNMKIVLAMKLYFQKKVGAYKKFQENCFKLKGCTFNRPPPPPPTPHPPTKKQSSHMCSWSLITLVALEFQILEITYIPNTILTQCSKKVKIVFGKSINRYMLEEIQHHFEVQGLWLWLQVRVLQFMHKKTI
jgi:hypothetical protein